MENEHEHMDKFGLIGKQIDYSFSRQYFSEKFEKEAIKNATYVNFDLETIEEFSNIFKENPNVKGLNVTIPYKEAVMPFLDKLNKKAKAIGAVNTIKITKKGHLKGYNTDCYGFKKTLKPFLKAHHKKALILGTGGASKAIAYTLKTLGIAFSYVSRTASAKSNFTYDSITETDIKNHQIIINSTPVGTFPDISEYPKIPYAGISEQHILFDLIYNPEETQFLKFGKQKKATTINGYKMLEFQAEKAWEIWDYKQ